MGKRARDVRTRPSGIAPTNHIGHNKNSPRDKFLPVWSKMNDLVAIRMERVQERKNTGNRL